MLSHRAEELAKLREEKDQALRRAEAAERDYLEVSTELARLKAAKPPTRASPGAYPYVCHTSPTTLNDAALLRIQLGLSDLRQIASTQICGSA